VVDNGEPIPRSCRVFLSYARESPEHIERVAQLYELLRNNGVDAYADIIASQDRQDWARWTHQQMSMADRVLVIVSSQYKRRVEGAAAAGIGRGVRHEWEFISEYLYEDPDAATLKFLPVLLPGATKADIPYRLKPASGSYYQVNSLTADGIRPLLRVLTGQPARVEPPLGPITVLHPEPTTPIAELRLLAGSDSRSADDELAWQLANKACHHAGIGIIDLGLVAVADGVTAVVPIVSGRDLLGRWIRALHLELKVRNREHRHGPVQARLGLHRWAPGVRDEATVALATALANCETARTMLGAPAAELVIATSDEFLELVEDGAVRFPEASAYCPLTMDRDGGRRCWVAVAGYSDCPELPPLKPSSGRLSIDRDNTCLGSMRDNFGSVSNIVNYGDKPNIHIGNVYGR
jgi:hypothetical protein